MVTSSFPMKTSSILLALCAALALVGCGGGSSSGSSTPGTQAPSTLYPSGVRLGQVLIGDASELSLAIEFPSTDFTQGANYDGLIHPSILTTDEQTEDEADTTPLPVSGTLRQITESAPGHVVLYFNSTAAPAINGVLRIELPAAEATDSDRVRTGKVESAEELIVTPAAGKRVPLNLVGKRVKITW